MHRVNLRLRLFFICLLLGLQACSTLDLEFVTVSYDAQGVVMVFVPGATFSLGIEIEDALQACNERISNSAGTELCRQFDFESGAPPISASVEPYWMDKYEVTFAQYRACIDAGVCSDGTLSFYQRHGISTNDDLPIAALDIGDAEILCEWRGARLPTEAEWEFAARGPLGFLYPWGNEFHSEFANLCDTSCERIYDEYIPAPTWNDGFVWTAPVGTFAEDVTWIGIHDMLGNVAEWTSDSFQPYEPEEYPLDHILWGVGNSTIRGASFESPAMLVSNMARRGAPVSDYSQLWIGFRCARSNAPTVSR